MDMQEGLKRRAERLRAAADMADRDENGPPGYALECAGRALRAERSLSDFRKCHECAGFCPTFPVPATIGASVPASIGASLASLAAGG